MSNRLPRILLVLAAFLLAGGGVFHALAFRKALSVIEGSNLPAFDAHAVEALWLSDATTLVAVASFYLYIAARPAAASRTALLLVTLIPLATALLIYTFVGNFIPGHILIVATLLAAVAAMLFPSASRSA
jgi:hypothetical protein